MVYNLAPPLDARIVLFRASKALSCICGWNRAYNCTRHACQIATDRPAQRSLSFDDAPPRHIHFILATLLVVLPALCAFYSIFRCTPSQSPPHDGAKPQPTSQDPGTIHLAASRGANQVARQVNSFASPQGTRPVDDQNVDRAEASVISSPAEVISGSKTDSSRCRRTSGVHAAPEDTTFSGTQDNPSPSIVNIHPTTTCLHASSSLECPGCEQCLGPASTADPTTPRGVAPNPVQNKYLSSIPPIGAHETIIKSLYDHPQPDAISQGQDDAPPPSPAHSSRALRQDPVDRTPLAAGNATTFFILLVAVGGHWLKDPKTDHDFILGAFQSAAVHLVSLLDDQATHESIQHALSQLYHKAQKCNGSAQVLVYLTGQGEKSGNMRLSETTVLNSRDLEHWLTGLYAESTLPRPAVGIIFDICRPDMPPNPSYDPELAIVWSCSAGQWSYALGFSPDLPSSCFLNSLFLASHDSLVQRTGFENAFKMRLGQQGALLQFIHRRKHEGGTCTECPTNGSCPRPDPQVPEWKEAGRDTLLALGELIKSEFPGVAHYVHDAVVKKMAAWKFLGPELRGPARSEV